MKNYFLAYRPFHCEYALRIIQEQLCDDENLIINHTEVIYKNADAKNLTFVPVPMALAGRIASLRGLRRRLNYEARSGRQISVFIPHTLGILANYSYYRLASKYENVKIKVFYEGVIVFYTYEHYYLKNLKHYVSRYIVSLFCGIRFKLDKRILNLQDERIAKIYSPFFNIKAPSQKMVKVELGKIEYTARPDTCIILGLKLPQKFDESMLRIIATIYQKIKELKVKNIYFKDHPYEKNDQFQKVALTSEVSLSIIEDQEPIEKIIDRYKPQYVFSIWSSGLINLKVMLPAEISLFSVVSKDLVESQNLEDLLRVFVETGIEVIWT